MYKRILVPSDGSDTGHRGLREAIALATEQKATLCLHVTSDFPIMSEMASAFDFEKYRKVDTVSIPMLLKTVHQAADDRDRQQAFEPGRRQLVVHAVLELDPHLAPGEVADHATAHRLTQRDPVRRGFLPVEQKLKGQRVDLGSVHRHRMRVRGAPTLRSVNLWRGCMQVDERRGCEALIA